MTLMGADSRLPESSPPQGATPWHPNRLGGTSLAAVQTPRRDTRAATRRVRQQSHRTRRTVCRESRDASGACRVQDKCLPPHTQSVGACAATPAGCLVPMPRPTTDQSRHRQRSTTNQYSQCLWSGPCPQAPPGQPNTLLLVFTNQTQSQEQRGSREAGCLPCLSTSSCTMPGPRPNATQCVHLTATLLGKAQGKRLPATLSMNTADLSSFDVYSVV